MAKAVQTSVIKKSLISLALLALLPTSAWADKTDDIVNKNLSRAKAGTASQKKIDDIADKTDKIVSKYNQESKVVEGLKIYNDRMRRTLTAQQVAMGEIGKVD